MYSYFSVLLSVCACVCVCVGVWAKAKTAKTCLTRLLCNCLMCVCVCVCVCVLCVCLQLTGKELPLDRQLSLAARLYLVIHFLLVLGLYFKVKTVGLLPLG